jgi:16S rRNA (adenine1518-N6/adenine1519-N6)-dimethyltransferase
VPLVIEIGPGKGALTEFLLERARTVVAIEVDPILVHYLRQKFHDALDAGRLILIEGDVLKTDLSRWGRAVIAGNLPYYITSPILEKVFTLPNPGLHTGLHTGWTRAVFLVQAEVAARLAAKPGTRAFGYLSVQAQLHANVEILFDVSRTAFKPPPKVESAVVRLEPRDAAAELGITDPVAFLRFAGTCFLHKRKTLRNNLIAGYGKDRVDALHEVSRRAEQLSLAELAALYRQLEP